MSNARIKPERLREQAEEIQEILEKTGLSADELAERVILKTSTMRNIVHGYQPASDRLMALIRAVAKLPRDPHKHSHGDRLTEDPPPPAELARIVEYLVADTPPAHLAVILRRIIEANGISDSLRREVAGILSGLIHQALTGAKK